MNALREHTGHGWGDPLDPKKPDRWLAHGRICDYDPARSTSSVWLVSTFDGVARGQAYINAARDKTAAAIVRARREYLWNRNGCNEIGSRFD